MADGFLGRWSRRKLDTRAGRPVEPELEPPQAAPAQPQAASVPVARLAPDAACGPVAQPAPPAQGDAAAPPPPPPTLDDVRALTPESDFRRFVAADTAPEVKNAALKKLFADPHYNLMDGLDVYIDDYSRPDPIPEAMLRQLASAEFLGLFRQQEEAAQPGAGPRDAADAQGPQTVAQSQPPGDVPTDASAPDAPDAPDAACGGPAPEHPSHDADPDLRLQQDHAAGPEGPGQGPR